MGRGGPGVRWRFTGDVGAPPERVVAQLRDRLNREWAALATVEPLDNGVAVQGHWWYRGEYRVDPAPPGSRVTYEVRNVAARGTRWMVPLATRGDRARHAAGFEQLLRALGQPAPDEPGAGSGG